MEYVIEFGNRSGLHTDNIKIPTAKLAASLAANMVMTFLDKGSKEGINSKDWVMNKETARLCWQSSTHFVAISKLDGKDRGPAASKLWKKENCQPQLVVCSYQ